MTPGAHVSSYEGEQGEGVGFVSRMRGGVTLLFDGGLLLQLTHRGRPGQLRHLPHF